LDRILLLCGHYEGVDQRAIDLYIDEELSIGDFVLTGGEIPAMAVADAVLRYVDGVINGESLLQESFSDGMLEYPHYTKPRVFNGLAVPEVLLSGNHAEIDAWRKKQSEKITAEKRPDLLSTVAAEENGRTEKGKGR
ncbi:MAG: tRNA (guanosine(37)-N1)-methyltransferase TrmD, partial [Clostridia bacterium]|nr:tRNA (guanosine(37)-N1)-methyltransferase TrmD [Clostridia bacterium]